MLVLALAIARTYLCCTLPLSAQVDVVVQGHEHAYARTCMLFKGECVGGGSIRTVAMTGELKASSGGGDSAMPSEAGRGERWGLSRAPVYVLAGNAGAGFTHGFPEKMPSWAVVAYQVRLITLSHLTPAVFLIPSGVDQDRNGYLRFEADHRELRMEAVSSDDGSVIDEMRISARNRG